MSVSKTSLCNMALARLGGKRINDLDDADTGPVTSNEAIWCRTFYDQTWRALLRSNNWNFARARATLSEDTETPEFDYDHQFHLPNDFLRLIKPDDYIEGQYSIEGRLLLTDDSAVELKYIRDIDDPNEADPLFIEVFILHLALKLMYAIAGTGPSSVNIKQDLKNELMVADRRARSVCFSDNNTTGASDWNNARNGSGIV